jgi:outer membrane protein OmpA-like peptidoglycan-associated protein
LSGYYGGFDTESTGPIKNKAMSFNVLEASQILLPEQLTGKAAVSLGESEQNIRKAIKAAIPSIIAGLLYQNARSDGTGIYDLLIEVSRSGVRDKIPALFVRQPMDAFATAASQNLIAGWLRKTFNAKLINIVNALSIYADIKSSSANTVLTMVTPIALAALAGHADENKLQSRDVSQLLQSQKEIIFKAIPVGYNLTGSFGVDTLENIATRPIISLPEPHAYAKAKTSTYGRWLWPVLLLVTFGGVLWFFSRPGKKNTRMTEVLADTLTRLIDSSAVNTVAEEPALPGKLDSSSGNFIYDTGLSSPLLLPDSTLISVGQNSTEARLIQVLKDSSWTADTLNATNGGITLDKVYFTTANAELMDESNEQLKNVGVILGHYRNAVIEIAGYTDNLGDSLINQQLSESRARAVLDALRKQGIADRQLAKATGYGSRHPVCSANDTPGCRARNRRVDLKLLSK